MFSVKWVSLKLSHGLRLCLPLWLNVCLSAYLPLCLSVCLSNIYLCFLQLIHSRYLNVGRCRLRIKIDMFLETAGGLGTDVVEEEVAEEEAEEEEEEEER